MAFVSAIVKMSVIGEWRIHFGTYTNGGGDTGGDVVTGLQTCHAMHLQPGGAAVIASAPTVNETLPVDGAAVTIVNTAGEDGTWTAIGK